MLTCSTLLPLHKIGVVLKAITAGRFPGEEINPSYGTASVTSMKSRIVTND